MEPEAQDTVEFVVDPEIAERVRQCTLSCSAVVTGLADLPAIESGGRELEVGLLRLRVRRPEGDAECCVRQQNPARDPRDPRARVGERSVLAHEHDRLLAIVDWTATGDWIGSKLTFPSAHEQYGWPEPGEWPASGEIEVHDVNGHRAELDDRRADWRIASADLLGLAPLRSRVDQRDEWRVTLELPDGNTIAIKDRIPLLALARLRPATQDRIGTRIDVLVSQRGDVVVDWESTLRQPELRPPRG